MLKNLRRLIRDFIPNPAILKKNHSAAFLNSFDSHSAAISRLEAFPHFDFESHEDLTKYTNISLVHPKDSNIFLNGIDTFIFDCDGVIVNLIIFYFSAIFPFFLLEFMVV